MANITSGLLLIKKEMDVDDCANSCEGTEVVCSKGNDCANSGKRTEVANIINSLLQIKKEKYVSDCANSGEGTEVVNTQENDVANSGEKTEVVGSKDKDYANSGKGTKVANIINSLLHIKKEKDVSDCANHGKGTEVVHTKDSDCANHGKEIKVVDTKDNDGTNSDEGTEIVYSKDNSDVDFVCHKCNRQFNTKGTLQKHCIVHSDTDPFVCFMCYDSFKKKRQLLIHLNLHKSNPPVSCYVCLKNFSSLQHLSAHLKLHSTRKSEQLEIKPMCCAICRKSFLSTGELLLHIYYDHRKNRNRYVCGICHEDFVDILKLQQHKHFQTNKNCKKLFYSEIDSNDFLKHLKVDWSTCQPKVMEVPKKGIRSSSKKSKKENQSTIELVDIETKQSDLFASISSITNSTDVVSDACSSGDGKVISSDYIPTSDSDSESELKLKSCPSVKKSRKVKQMAVKVPPTSRKISCESCKKEFPNNASRLKHKCSKKAKTNQAVAATKLLVSHKISCRLCKKKFRNVASKVKHKCPKGAKKTKKGIYVSKYNKFTCELCNKIYQEKYALRWHMKITHGTKEDFIEQNSESNSLYEECSGNERPHYCKICGECFRLKKTLTTHRFVHQEETPFKCPLCGLKFKRHVYLNQHSKAVHGVPIQSNDDIPNKEPLTNLDDTNEDTEVDLDENEEKSNKNEDLKCEICDKVFDVPYLLRNHRETHGIVSFLCQFCKKQFQNQKNLSFHIQKHHWVGKKYMCFFCKKTFISIEHLSVHAAKHTIYKCDKCNEMFKAKKRLRKHYHHIHAVLSCSFCPQTFKTKVNLRHHFLNSHPDALPYKCKVCPKRFKSECVLRSHHRKVHHFANRKTIFECQECRMTFFCQQQLRQHLEKDHDRNIYGCEKCDKWFLYKNSLKIHIISHSNEKSFECSVCQKPFKYLMGLRRHERVLHGMYKRKEIKLN